MRTPILAARSRYGPTWRSGSTRKATPSSGSATRYEAWPSPASKNCSRSIVRMLGLEGGHARDAQQAGEDRTEEVSGDARDRGEHDDLSARCDRIPLRPTRLHDADGEHDDGGESDRTVQRCGGRQQQVRDERDERREPERGAHDDRTLQGTAALFDDEPELLLDHRLEEDARFVRELRRDAPRRGLGEALLLEHVRDLGLRFPRPVAHFLTLVLD